MSLHYIYPITNSRGLGKVIYFSGLMFPVVVTPSIFGEPILTAQPFYFLEQLEAVVRMEFKTESDLPPAKSRGHLEKIFEYVIDNYLFAYSKKHPSSKLTSKLTEFRFWEENPDDHYFKYDGRISECLVLDTLNDDSIIDCKDANHPSKEVWYDWCLFKNYASGIHEEYVTKLKEAMRHNVLVKTKDRSSLGTGEQNLPIIKTQSSPLTLDQVEMFECIRPVQKFPEKAKCLIHRGTESSSNFEVPVEAIATTSYYNPELLSYYFCALRDHSPLAQFRNFFNVVEFFFEDDSTSKERKQLEAVIRWVTTAEDLMRIIQSLPSAIITRIAQKRTASNGAVISALTLNAADIITEFSNRLYEIRCACVHSKQKRKGQKTLRFVPATSDEEIIWDELPMIQWLAAKCIEKQTSPSDSLNA